MEHAASPQITVIVPTFNRPQYAVQTIEQIQKQDFSDFELFIMDQSEPALRQQLQNGLQHALQDDRVTLVFLDRPGLCNARNEGLARARGRIIVFLDDDVILLTPSFLRAHWSSYDDATIGAVNGRTVERVNRENARRTVNRVTQGGRTVANLLGQERCLLESLKGANMSFRVEAIVGMGGFDRNYTGTALLEEADFALRLRRRGWQLAFEPGAELFHLSASVGGVRVANADKALLHRFTSTAYFVTKHRGLAGLVPFAAQHSIVALYKAIRQRRPGLLVVLFNAATQGVSRARGTPDQDLPAGRCNHATPSLSP